MIHGEQQLDQSSSSFENVVAPENGGGPSQTANATVGLSTQEEKERIIERIEREMEVFRKGECSRFQASSRVTNELSKWEGVLDKERGKALDSYLAKINSFIAIQDENRSTSGTRGTSPPLGSTLLPNQPHARKRVREEVEELLDRVSQGELEGEETDHRVA